MVPEELVYRSGRAESEGGLVVEASPAASTAAGGERFRRASYELLRTRRNVTVVPLSMPEISFSLILSDGVSW